MANPSNPRWLLSAEACEPTSHRVSIGLRKVCAIENATLYDDPSEGTWLIAHCGVRFHLNMDYADVLERWVDALCNY